MRTLLARLAALLRRRRLDRELDLEVAFHLAMLEEDCRSRGMTPAGARLAARREFGGVAQVKETYRERRGLPWLEITILDFRRAIRGLCRNPGFTAAAVLSLALGIGVNTAVFSLFYALMLRTLPVERPGELTAFHRSDRWGDYFTYPDYLNLAKRTDLFQGVIGRTAAEKKRLVLPDREATVEYVEFVSGNYFSVLGVAPALGRLFTTEDNRVPGGHPVAVLSHDLWLRNGADPGVVGRTLRIDDQQLTVIGVAAPGFHGLEVERCARAWAPAVMSLNPVGNGRTYWIQVLARSKPGISQKHAQAALNTDAHSRPDHGAGPFRIELRNAALGRSTLREEFGVALSVLSGSATLVLLVACANLANLLLARATARRKQHALQLALGASRARLSSLALLESLLLAFAGGAAGLIVAWWGRRAIVAFLPNQSGDPFLAAPDRIVAAIAVAASLASAALFGIWPAWRAASVNPIEALRSAGGSISARKPALRRAFVTAQVGFSSCLVSLAVVLGHSLFELRSVDLGFSNQDTISFRLVFPGARPQHAEVAYGTLLRRLEQLPEVISVSSGFPGPFQMGRSNQLVRVPELEQAGLAPVESPAAYIEPDYFKTLGMAVVMGRDFNSRDTAGAGKVAIVNEAFLRTFFPDASYPLGRTLRFDDTQAENAAARYIVGVVRDTPSRGLRESPLPTVYVPWAQAPSGIGKQRIVLVHGKVPADRLLKTISRHVTSLGAGIEVADAGTIRQRIDDSIFRERMLATTGGFFGTLALLVAGVGLYGIVAYGVAQRRAEIAIRLALGAPRVELAWVPVRNALLLVAGGLAMGVPAAYGAARALRSLLFGVTPADPIAFAITSAALIIVATAAALLPARRAARMDPMEALRHE